MRKINEFQIIALIIGIALSVIFTECELSFALVITVIATIVSMIIFGTPKFKGIIGERKVAQKLNYIAKKRNGYVINDVIIPNENGKTCQLDHILFLRTGIYVIETKNYNGIICGNDYDNEWSQTLAFGKVKNKFYSPVKQNNTHIYNLSRALDKELYIDSVVVFVQGDLKYVKSSKTFTYYTMTKAFDGEEKMSQNDIILAYNKIVDYYNKPVATMKEHLKNIKQSQKDINSNICPRCGSPLVQRVSSKDGSSFWGCSSYPKCKFIKK